MPTNPKTARCVKHVMDKGKDKVSAIKICQASTGIPYHKKSASTHAKAAIKRGGKSKYM